MNINNLLNKYTIINNFEGFNNEINNNEILIYEIFDNITTYMNKTITNKIKRLFIIKFLILLYIDLSTCIYEDVIESLHNRFYYKNYNEIIKRYYIMSNKLPLNIKSLYHFDILPYIIHTNRYEIIKELVKEGHLEKQKVFLYSILFNISFIDILNSNRFVFIDYIDYCKDNYSLYNSLITLQYTWFNLLYNEYISHNNLDENDLSIENKIDLSNIMKFEYTKLWDSLFFIYIIIYSYDTNNSDIYNYFCNNYISLYQSNINHITLSNDYNKIKVDSFTIDKSLIHIPHFKYQYNFNDDNNDNDDNDDNDDDDDNDNDDDDNDDDDTLLMALNIHIRCYDLRQDVR